jgi:serine/threonine protein kinase
MRCRHTNIARMYGYWFDQCASGPTDVFFLYEYPLNGHLLDILIHDEKRQNLTAKRRVKILYEVSRALLFLHKGLMDGTTKYTFCHRDVKSSSIYLTADYTAKLMDCGLSVIAGDASSSVEASGMKLSFATMDDFNVIGTPGYVCPSYASGKMQCYDSSCDLYSFGIVIMEVLTGWPQFGQSNLRSCSQNLIRKYHEKTLLLNGLDEMAGDEWNHVASDLCDCAFSCVQIDHRERPSTEEIFELLSDVYTRLVLSPNTSPTKQ